MHYRTGAAYAQLGRAVSGATTHTPRYNDAAGSHGQRVEYEVDDQVEEEPQPTLGAIFMTGGNFAPTTCRRSGPRPGVRHRCRARSAGSGRGGQDIEEGDWSSSWRP